MKTKSKLISSVEKVDLSDSAGFSCLNSWGYNWMMSAYSDFCDIKHICANLNLQPMTPIWQLNKTSLIHRIYDEHGLDKLLKSSLQTV